MKNAELVCCKAQHEPYDPSNSFTGGSYFQPHGEAIWQIGSEKVAIRINDTSCGGFGSRVHVRIENEAFCFGSMDDASIDEDYADECIDRLSRKYGADFNSVVVSSVKAVRRNSICEEDGNG